ncbi:MAG: hypothetical protein EOO20_12940 [Chryseobacterium sp.]|nr:MAG: hypothetical protein EOO20_12940 [Chryseobacterium sp.]
MQYPNLPSTPVLATKTDSVISHMQYKIDSLSKVVEKTEIAHGFFSDVISQDLYMFSTIIVIAGLVSWGFVAGVLALHKKSVLDNVDAKLDKKFKEYTEAFEELKIDVEESMYDVERAMYFNVETNADQFIPFEYSIEVLRSLIKLDVEDDLIPIWLEASLGHLKKIPDGHSKLYDKFEGIIKILDSIKEVSQEPTHKIIKEIKSLIYLKAHSPSNPPEDILQGHAQTPPIVT